MRIFNEVHLDWRDRIRVLFGRLLHVDVTLVDGVATSHTWVERVRTPWQNPGGYAETNEVRP